MAYLLPAVETREQWSAIFTDLAQWRPVVSRICAQEGLACDSVEAGYPGTNAVFLVDRRYAVKVYSPFWKDFGVEKELHIALGHEARVPVPQMVASGRFVDRIDWGYLITEFLEGEPVRELRGALSRDDLIAIAADLGRMGGYVNRCVNDIRRRPSQPLAQRRFHPRIECRDRRLRSTQGPSDA